VKRDNISTPLVASANLWRRSQKVMEGKKKKKKKVEKF
jgi:hypothetical protein